MNMTLVDKKFKAIHEKVVFNNFNIIRKKKQKFIIKKLNRFQINFIKQNKIN